MKGFVDEVTISVASGKGGAGAVSFRREKYIPKGGPDGGDGGRGGSVFFQTKRNLKTLAHLHFKRNYHAGNGQPGGGRKKHGLDGKDVIIEVPPGTLLRDLQSGEVIKDLTGEEKWCFLKGGLGGKGNVHFKSSVKQTPRYAQPGLPGEEREIRVELNMIADVGFVGFPNAGKSSLLDFATNAHPVIASYPFTTKIPNLGVLYVKEQDIILADIPGIIEGASRGAGLGFRFLKHISRTAVLAFLIDLSDSNYEKAFDLLCEELRRYSPELLEKKRIVIASKTDLDEGGEHFKRLQALLPNEELFPLSVFARTGLNEIALKLLSLTVAYRKESELTQDQPYRAVSPETPLFYRTPKGSFDLSEGEDPLDAEAADKGAEAKEEESLL